MKTFLVILGMLVMFTAGGATIYYGDAWYFEKATGGTPLTDIYEAEMNCEVEYREHCSLAGGFYPDSYFEPPKFKVENGI